MGRLRILLALLMVDWTIGTPGLGVETRTSGPDLVGWAFGVTFLALIVALVLTWFGKRYAGPLAMAGGAMTVLLSVADIAGVLAGTPPPGIIAIDAVAIAIAAGIIWAATRMGQRTPSAA